MTDRRTYRGKATNDRRWSREVTRRLFGQASARLAPLWIAPADVPREQAIAARPPRMAASRLPRIMLGSKAIIVLLVSAVALCLGALMYVQHTNNVIVDHDLQTAVALSEIAARFDHEDGNLYRMMVDEAANGQSPAAAAQLAGIRLRIERIGAELTAQEERLPRRDRRRAAAAVRELANYNDAVGVVSSMLEINFASSVAMLRPFRTNADRVLAEIKGIAASGIADAHRHAEAAAWRTRSLVACVTLAVLIVAGLSYLWLALAAKRGMQLRAEIERRWKAEQEALELARTDVLTGLDNRRAFGAMLDLATSAAQRGDHGLCVILIDLDGFKDVNDTHGHAAGDAVLTTVAQRLQTVFGAGGSIARLGGDEFAILLSEPWDSGDLGALLTQIGGILAQPLGWRGNTIGIGASIGAARYPDDGRAADDLLHAADIAMYKAKRTGKGGACVFTPDMENERRERRRLEEDLRIAITGSEIRPFYQPIIRFPDATLCGFEVLARWQHPRLGLLAPDTFIRLAEQSGQITALTKALVRQACRDALRMPDYLRLAINISPIQLEEPGLAEALIAIIEGEGLAPSRIEIELTENAVMDDVATAERVLQTFRASGISIALDDFGTGYSSLSNLRRLKFDKLKIDQSFVRTLGDSVESEKLVDAIIGLALSFDMNVTAEGIEDPAVAAMLVTKGCTHGQGYLFGKPLAFDDTKTLFSP